MKHLIFTLLLFAACSKPTITYETKKVFYKLQEVDKDGKVITESETKSTEITIQNKIGDEGGEHHDEDEDDDNCPVPIKINSFVVIKVNSNTVKVYWEATNEDGVSHYNILKSIDAQKNWDKVVEIIKGSGKYEYIDKF